LKDWIEHWAGSAPHKGWSIRCGRDTVVWLGETVSGDDVTAIVLAHNAKRVPFAYSYELAQTVRDGVYSDFRAFFSVAKPNVPEGSIRNLKPLYE
jgi:Ethanolamine utilization protein EutJ (predicted chaperonin)